ncbi:MAG: hypothetical protein ACJ76A_02160 [Actinomycetota bacterium]
MSAKIWWPLAMVALVALVLTVPAANHAADRARRESAARAIVISAQQIEPLTATGASVADLNSALADIQRANPTYDAVRVWTPGKLLVASSVPKDPLFGGTAGVSDSDIDGALSTGSRLEVTNREPTGDVGPTTVHTYTKIDGPTAAEVTEFEASDAALLAQVHHDWNGYRIVAAAAFLFLLALALLSMREPVADIGVGVPFYPASLPPNLAIVDAERAVVIEHEDDHVRQRVASLQQRLDESERQRLKAEARLQQALTTLGTGGRNVPGLPPEPPTPTLPPSRTAGRRPTPVDTTAAPAAVAPVVPTTSPVVEPAATAAASSPKHLGKKRSTRRGAEKPATERTPAPRRSRADEPADPAATTPQPAPATPEPAPATPERVTVSADDMTVTAQPAAASAAKPADAPEVVILPADKPASVAAASAVAPTQAATVAPPKTAVPAKTAAPPAKAPAPAPAKGPPPAKAAEPEPGADVLHRLVPDADAHPAPVDDPSDLRARLARTAALKKPGSKERQDQRESFRDLTSEQ